MKFKNLLIKCLDLLTFISFVILISIVLIQILGRTPLLPRAFHWTEELTRMIFIFLVSITSITAVLNNEFVSVDLITSRFTGQTKIIIDMVTHFVLGAFLLYLTPAANKFMMLGARQLSPGLRISRQYVYGFMLLCILGMGLAQVYMGIKKIIELKTNRKETE
ncbi:TRAP-type C4-dicarboxylate transport system permease small subunit [Natranaerovirga hydrolytica]|uniref:TRAP-type C4-dicarboxylate transport system permease small subunit n=1 Tax=Natranaerovirga hydrolytica TaxID=680378 RepID=A0A4R1MS46_9FIRM|nr:TRAP transporter small permease [Natranaerovirga hydrolytica]TCK92743.1 TRAP-type C4-dicarboxylate transport system permease small subunit [Natranaerovirga hydrolytica]